MGFWEEGGFVVVGGGGGGSFVIELNIICNCRFYMLYVINSFRIRYFY